MLNHILLAVDGSPGSRKAADFARRLVAGTPARLTVLVVLEAPTASVIPVLEGVAYTAPHPSAEELAVARDVMVEIEAALGHEHVVTRLDVGHPAEVVCSVAEELGVDLIVLGAHGGGGVARWLIGSVGERVARHATRPVTVVR